MAEEPETRRYHLLERLGEGGFGVVYRARLEGPQGFAKDVAIKILRDGLVPEGALRRFRDEARILGLVRDRAIVGVDPPTRLDGRWALVMEYVDGASLARILQDGPVPASVALEIVGEVARALDVAFHLPGPDGRPLGLVHRDLKPANLQITPTGQVKLLDFGIARARFDAREARTTTHLPGTPGYMAPERLQGVEGPEGDVYSLGVVLHEAVTGSRPDGAAPAEGSALDLARSMRDPDPARRPTAREVEERCAALRGEGPTLRRWAETRVPRGGEPADERVGTVLTRTLDAEPAGPRRWPWIAGGAAVLGLLALFEWAWPRTWDPPRAGDPPLPLEQAARQPFLDFVMEIDAATSERTSLRDPAAWDGMLYAATTEHLRAMAADRTVWQRIDQVWSTWGEVVTALREAGLPEVASGIPWVESRYTPELQSAWCAKGLWQFMPETAHRSGPVHGVPLRVEGCRFTDDPLASWGPTSFAPPAPHPYVKDGRCRIPERLGCAVDDRTDVGRSTAAAVAMLGEAFSDPALRASGGVVQLAIASHVAGYDDSRFDVPRPTNVLPAYTAWAASHRDEEHPWFLTDGAVTGNAPLDYEVTDYVAHVIAAHFAAVCFYAANYPEHPPFAAWEKYTDGYCRSLDVPSRADVAEVR